MLLNDHSRHLDLVRARRHQTRSESTDIHSTNESAGLGISSISIWEVAKAVKHGKLVLPVDTESWLRQASNYPGIQILALTPEICVESANLPGVFHKDPADQLIVATARILDTQLVTADSKIRSYPHVKLFV